MLQAKHIGIVACSAPGAALCYSTICAEAPQVMGRQRNPEISLHMMDFYDHVRCMERDDWDGVAHLVLRSVTKLAAAGASFAICPDNTVHIAMPKVERSSPLPWLHIADVVADAAKKQGYRRSVCLARGISSKALFIPKPSLRTASISAFLSL